MKKISLLATLAAAAPEFTNINLESNPGKCLGLDENNYITYFDCSVAPRFGKLPAEDGFKVVYEHDQSKCIGLYQTPRFTSLYLQSCESALVFNSASHFYNAGNILGYYKDFQQYFYLTWTDEFNGIVYPDTSRHRAIRPFQQFTFGTATAGNIIGDWSECHPSADKCLSSNFSCCIAPEDKATQKYTCRPAGYCS